MYVAVKGGEKAIEASRRLLEKQRRGDSRLAELSVSQIREQLRLAVARVMTEGALYDEELAALAIKQAAGDLVEAIFLLRAYRTTLPRFGYSAPLDVGAMAVQRRISAIFKDVPGGQFLGATHDFTQRLLDFSLLADGGDTVLPAIAGGDDDAISLSPARLARVYDLLEQRGLIAQEETPADAPDPVDLALEPLHLPAERPTRLQNLARGDEGFLLAMAYATQRGYGGNHPFTGELRFGTVSVEVSVDELDGAVIDIGDLAVTECQTINQFHSNPDHPLAFTQGYGLAFGHSERKAIAMALVDRALCSEELGETITSPAQDPEFMLLHSDNVEASGFVQHLKLPHYVDFQVEVELLRRFQANAHRADATDEIPLPVERDRDLAIQE